jgi:hypothetical protein
MKKIALTLFINIFLLFNAFAVIDISGNNHPCARFNVNDFTGAEAYWLVDAMVGPNPNNTNPYVDNIKWTGTNIGNISHPNNSITTYVTFKNNSATTTLVCKFDYHYYENNAWHSYPTQVSMAMTVLTIGEVSNITGPASIAPCVTSNVTYSIPAVTGSYINYTWTLPPGWTSPNPLSGSNLKSITVTPNATSGGQVTVTVCSGACSNLCIAKSINVVRVSAPVFTTTQNAYCLMTTSSAQFCVSAIPNVTTYNWTYPTGWSGPSSSTTPCVTVNFNGNAKTGANIGCYGTMSCGANSSTTYFSVTTDSNPPTDAGVSLWNIAVTSTPTPAKKNISLTFGSYVWTVSKHTKVNGQYQQVSYYKGSGGIPYNIVMTNGERILVSAFNENSCGRSTGLSYGYDLINGTLTIVDLPRPAAINEEQEATFMISPNPASSSLIIACDKMMEANYNLSIYDMLGKKVQETSKMSSNNTTIDVSGLENGTYFLNVDNGSSIIRREKIIINH